MSFNNTRREILKIVGGSTAIGFSNTANASSEDDSNQLSSIPDSQKAITFRNNSLSTEKVTLSISNMQESDPDPVYQYSSIMEPDDYEVLDAGELNLGDAAYRVKVELIGQSEIKSTVWKLPGGIPDWKRISVHVKPESKLSLYNKES